MKTPGYMKAQPNKIGMFLVAVVVLMVLIVVTLNGIKLQEKQASCTKRETYLLNQIEEQNQRALEIEEYKKYMQTKEYVEDMAKDKLGLVYPDELILEAGN